MCKRIFVWLLTLAILVTIAGCKITEQGVHVDPNTAALVETQAEAAVTALQALAVIWPGFAAAALVLAQALRAWRKAKGDLTLTTNALAGVVAAVDDLKENATAWKALKPLLSENTGPASENVIREARGLPPIA